MFEYETDCEVLLFVSSSGRCNLDCQYCIVDPEGRRQASLSFEDLQFIYEHFGKKAFFMFSGKGDFFSGYDASDQLLSRLLELDVEVGLDINATILQEMPSLPAAKLEKIRHVNVAMHYHELVRINLLKRWAENARWILTELDHAYLIVGTVMDPGLEDEWEAAMEFYGRNIFESTGKKLHLIRHLNHVYSESEESRLAEIAERYSTQVEIVLEQDYAAMFADHPEVHCPAGKTMFRIWPDGLVQGCPHIAELSPLGGLKERIIKERNELIPCRDAAHCECFFAASLGKMEYP